MFTLKDWRVKIDKDGTPYIKVPYDMNLKKEKVQLNSEDITFTQAGIEFRQTDKNDAVQEFECLYKYLSSKQASAPLSEMVRLGEVQEEKQHSLVFLYELVAGVVLRSKPIVKDKSWDMDALLNKYSYLGWQIVGVDFKKTADSLYRKLTGGGVNKDGRYFFE